MEQAHMNLSGARVVARYADGRLIKGYTFDFEPGRARFRVFPGPNAARPPAAVMLSELKAVFFVRDLAGNAHYSERKQFVETDRAPGRRVEVTFADGEVLVGVAEGSESQAPGLFLVPVDSRSNNLKVYAVPSAIRGVRDLPKARPTGRAALPARPRVAAPLLPRRLAAWLTG